MLVKLSIAIVATVLVGMYMNAFFTTVNQLATGLDDVRAGFEYATSPRD